MNNRQRLEAVFAGKTADRTPVLGGWISCASHLIELAGATREEYVAAPMSVALRAYNALGVDGLVSMLMPRVDGDYRIVDEHSYAHADHGESLEEAVARIEKMPDAAAVERAFDFETEYAKLRSSLLGMQAECGDLVWMPAMWGAGAKVSWYFDFGYENFFMIVGMYPDAARKLMEIGGAYGRCQCRLAARAVKEGIYPHAVFLGEDICTQRGPMVSPDFLERYYAPQLKYGLEPLLEAGCKPVWHCDGDFRPLLDMLIDCGVQGFQGFQPECGLTIDSMVERRTRDGKPLLIFGPLSVTTELPVCSPEEIVEKVRHAIRVSRGNADLVLFTANTINPDVPLANIRAMMQAVRET